MAPTSSNEPAPVKHITLHHFLKQQLLQQHRLKPAVMWGWPAAAAATIGRHAPEDAADDDDGLGGAWPPRSYTCAFCRREFRSAQALGGHMNVHRRDRAKMRGGNNGGAAAAQVQLVAAAAAAATDEAPHAAAAATKYAVLYPILDSNNAAAGAVFIPSGDVLLSAPVALATAHDQCHVSDDEEEVGDKDVDLELRLWWP